MEHRRQSKHWHDRVFCASISVHLHAIDTLDYKNKGGLKQDDLRRRREEQQVEIRRQKREENISKRRNFLPSSGADSDEEAGGSGGLDAPVSVVDLI